MFPFFILLLCFFPSLTYSLRCAFQEGTDRQSECDFGDVCVSHYYRRTGELWYKGCTYRGNCWGFMDTEQRHRDAHRDLMKSCCETPMCNEWRIGSDDWIDSAHSTRSTIPNTRPDFIPVAKWDAFKVSSPSRHSLSYLFSQYIRKW